MKKFYFGIVLTINDIKRIFNDLNNTKSININSVNTLIK